MSIHFHKCLSSTRSPIETRAILNEVQDRGTELFQKCLKASPIAERSKLSDRGWGDRGSNLGEGRFFSAFFQDGELS